MAKLTKTSSAETGMGMLQPQLSYRWRLRFPGSTLTTEEHNRMACQALSVDIDYAKKELTIELVQDAITTLLHEAIMKIFDRETVVIHIDSLDGTNTEPLNILEFTCEPKAHGFRLDYASRGDTANHYIRLDIVRLLPYNNEDNLAAATPSIDIKEETKMK